MAEKGQSDLDRSIERFVMKHPILVFGVIGIALVYFFRDTILTWLGNQGDTISGAQNIVSSVFEVVLYVSVAFLILYVARSIFVEWYNRKQFKYIRLLPHSKDRVNAEEVQRMLSRLHGNKRNSIARFLVGREWFSYLIYRDSASGEFSFYIGAHQKLLNEISASISSVYPRCEFHEADSLLFPNHIDGSKGEGKRKRVGGRMKIKSDSVKKALPLARYKKDDFPSLLGQMHPGSWLQVNFSANYGRKIRKNIVELEKDIKQGKKVKDRTAFDKEEIKGLGHRFSRNEVAFDVTVSLATTAHDGVPKLKQLGNTINSDLHDVNELKYRRYKDSVQYYPRHVLYRMTWTGAELANLLHLPVLDDREAMKKIEPSIPHLQPGRETLPKDVFSNDADIFVGFADHPVVKDRAIYIDPAFLGEHFGLFGTTGSGKSSVYNNLLGRGFVDLFIRKRVSPGFTFCDPARDTAVVILNQLLAAEKRGNAINWDKVHWIEFSNAENPIGLNLLHKVPGANDGVIADAITELIEANFDDGAKVAQRLLNYCIRTLLADPDENRTILEVKLLLDDVEFRNKLLNKIKKDPENYELINYWSSDADENMKTSSVAVKNRIDMFSSSPALKRSFGQRRFDLDIQKYMDDGHLILMDLSDLGKREVSLICGYLSYLYYRVAERRPTYPNMHVLAYDEMARVGYIKTLSAIIAEMRKRGLSLGVGSQRLAQLDEKLRDALTNIQDNHFVCSQGADDAPYAAKLVNSSSDKNKYDFPASYLSSLEPLHMVMKMPNVNREKERKKYTCQVVVPPLNKFKRDMSIAPFKSSEEVAESDNWTLEKASQLSKKHGRPTEEVDMEILEYMNPYTDLTEYKSKRKNSSEIPEENLKETPKEEPEMDDRKHQEEESNTEDHSRSDNDDVQPKKKKKGITLG